jgi:hypothetical protein
VRQRRREWQVWDSQAGTELHGYSPWQDGSLSGQIGLPLPAILGYPAAKLPCWWGWGFRCLKFMPGSSAPPREFQGPVLGTAPLFLVGYEKFKFETSAKIPFQLQILLLNQYLVE